MPRYRYACEKCEEITEAFHSYKETLTDCVKCESLNSLTRLLNTPRYVVKKKPTEDIKVGDITQKFIEENREILKQQKKETKKEKHVKD